MKLQNPFKEQTLYRYWQGDDLLYVGIAANAYSRAAQHSETARWWPEASHVTFEKYASREEVLIAEKMAIKREHPQYNITHNTGARSPERLYGQIVQRQTADWENYSQVTRRSVTLERNRILTGLEAIQKFYGLSVDAGHENDGTTLPMSDCCDECSLFTDIWMMTDDPENLTGYWVNSESGVLE
jgi:hypothetical protein